MDAEKTYIHYPEVQSHLKLHGISEGENGDKLTYSCAVGCNWLCLTGAKCQFLFSLSLSCRAFINGTAPEGHEPKFSKNSWCTRVHKHFKKSQNVQFFTFFAPSKFLQTLCHAHVGSGVHGMHCYTPNQT